MKKYVVQEAEPEYGPPKNMKEAMEQIDLWRSKYIKCMEQQVAKK